MSKETQSNTTSEYYLSLFQSEFTNLISTKSFDQSNFKQLIEGMESKKLSNGEDMDIYLTERLFSTLLPGLESLSKTIEKMIYHSKREDEREVSRFNPCNYLGEFLMRNNPKYGKNLETHEKFLKYTREERKKRILSKEENNSLLRNRIIKHYDAIKIVITKLSILDFVSKLDERLKLKGTLKEFDWVEYFRARKDDQKISIESFYDAYYDAMLKINSIDEGVLIGLLK